MRLLLPRSVQGSVYMAATERQCVVFIAAMVITVQVCDANGHNSHCVAGYITFNAFNNRFSNDKRRYT